MGDIEGVDIFFDDIKISGRTQEEYDQLSHEILSRVKSAGLTSNIEKCEFSKTKVQYLRYEIISEGIHHNRRKNQKNLSVNKIPKCQRIAVILGIKNQYSKCIVGYVDIIEPLYKLLR